MELTVIKIPFSAIGAGGTIATVTCPSTDLIGFAIEVTSIGGAPTNFTATAFERTDLSTEATPITFDSGNGINTGAKTTTGRYPLDLWGTTVVGPFFRNSSRVWRLVATFTGGATPTITGNAYAFLGQPRY